jgi:hypothetical protein
MFIVSFLFEICLAISISIVGSWIIMMQEGARVVAHLKRFAVYNLCWRFDWFCGKKPDFVIWNKFDNLVKSIFYFCIVVFYLVL